MDTLTIYFTVLFISFTYLLIGFGINKKNAKYLLAGYNTMRNDQRDKFDIESYLQSFKPFFKKLALFPPITFILVSIFFKGENLVLVWSVLQLVPFIFFYKINLRF